MHYISHIRVVSIYVASGVFIVEFRLCHLSGSRDTRYYAKQPLLSKLYFLSWKVSPLVSLSLGWGYPISGKRRLVRSGYPLRTSSPI